MKFIFAFLALVLVVVLAEDTPCQEHRKRELKSTAPLPLRVIPECDANGDYLPLQCFQNSPFCYCWKKNGDIITQPSKKIKACDCVVQKHTASQNAAPGVFIPQCEENGKYKTKQCHGSTGMCWCVNEKGQNTTTPTRGNNVSC